MRSGQWEPAFTRIRAGRRTDKPTIEWTSAENRLLSGLGLLFGFFSSASSLPGFFSSGFLSSGFSRRLLLVRLLGRLGLLLLVLVAVALCSSFLSPGFFSSFGASLGFTSWARSTRSFLKASAEIT
jgi:hypothetical protein